MLSEKMGKALNGQLNAELYSSHLYLSMSAYFQSINLAGFANWMRVQAQEELVHSIKFYDYVNERDHATTTFLQWFVTEQVEEEAWANEVVQQLKLVGGDGGGLFMIDRELGQPRPDSAQADGRPECA